MRHVRIRRPDHTCKRWSPLCVAGPNFCHLSRAQGANLPLTLCQCAGTISSSSWRRRAPRTTPGRLGGVAGPASAGANGSATIYLSTQADRKKTCEGGEGSRRDRESGARGSGSGRARGRGRASLVIAPDFSLEFAGFFPREKSRKTREISGTSREKSGK